MARNLGRIGIVVAVAGLGVAAVAYGVRFLMVRRSRPYAALQRRGHERTDLSRVVERTPQQLIDLGTGQGI